MTTFTRAELAQLLARPVRRILTEADRRAFTGRRVLITGAGGSIGAELARHIARCAPMRLTLVDHSEHALFQLERELASLLPAKVIDPVLADVTRRAFVQRAFAASRPHLTYHAAAYKHVTMAERAVCAAAHVNVLGTAHVVSAARTAGSRFMLVSSDKAAAPVGVMGATKRFAEWVVMSQATRTFRPAVVRFGNVLGSSGSLLTILRECIRGGHPVPVTDPEATRYWMTASEAVSLMMKVGAGDGGAATYWLDMGEPVSVGELVRRMMVLEAAHGFRPVPVDIIGLRAGEKRRERLVEQGTALRTTGHPCIVVAEQPGLDRPRLARALAALRRAVTRADDRASLAALREAVPGFTRTVGAVVSLVARVERPHRPEA